MKLQDGENITPTLTTDSSVRQSASVSLIVPTFYNQPLKRGSLQYLISGIARSECVREVILVAADGNIDSLKPMQECVGKLPLKIVKCSPERRAYSRNVGAEAASYEILLFLDDDMLLQDWRIVDVILSEMLTTACDCALFPRRTYLRFPLLYENGRFDDAVSRWRRDADSLTPDELLDPVKDGSPFKTMAFCFPGCFMMITRESFDRIGRFPEGYRGWGFEDTDFAMRAVSGLEVLNLFRRVGPLTHVDHPVSPYKSEEYQRNLNQFYEVYNPLDMDWLCRQVFAGDDFRGGRRFDEIRDSYLDPIRDVTDNYLPVTSDLVVRNYEHVLQERLKLGLAPIPEVVTLHGSRGAGTSEPDSDFDVLFLFRGSGAAEHFVCDHNGTVVEFEHSDFTRFETFAIAPALYAMRGPLELAKLAQSRVLWGNSHTFAAWRIRVLTIATKVGLPVWCLSAIGMALEQEKSSGMLSRYLQAMRRILESPVHQPSLDLLERVSASEHIDSASLFGLKESEPQSIPVRTLSDQFQIDAGLLNLPVSQDLTRYTLSLMDRELPEWREDMGDSKRVFVNQIPEIWRALRYLLATELSGNQ
ncbi:MAG: hypothetical protein KDA96_08300 [Planctomycetaceae bacterium]|nr:hypothetical protein [Planctomycetaceae bacterium]